MPVGPSAHRVRSSATIVGDHTVGSNHANRAHTSPSAAGSRKRKYRAHGTELTAARNRRTCPIGPISRARRDAGLISASRRRSVYLTGARRRAIRDQPTSPKAGVEPTAVAAWLSRRPSGLERARMTELKPVPFAPVITRVRNRTNPTLNALMCFQGRRIDLNSRQVSRRLRPSRASRKRRDSCPSDRRERSTAAPQFY